MSPRPWGRRPRGLEQAECPCVPGTGLHMIRRDLASDVCCTLASADGMRTIPPSHPPTEQLPRDAGQDVDHQRALHVCGAVQGRQADAGCPHAGEDQGLLQQLPERAAEYVDDENIPSYLGGRIISVGVEGLHQTIRKGFMPWALCIAASCRVMKMQQPLRLSGRPARGGQSQTFLCSCGRKVKGSLVDDVGPWQQPQLIAEINAGGSHWSWWNGVVSAARSSKDVMSRVAHLRAGSALHCAR